MAEADDWIVDDGHPQDWVQPQPANIHDKIGARDPLNVSPGSPGARVLEAAGRGAKEGFGDEPLGLSPKSEAELAKLGIFHEPGKGYVGPAGAVQLLNEAVLRPTAAGVDAFFRALSAGTTAVAAGAGQAAQELGQSPAQAAKLTRDVYAGEDIAMMSHVPERGLLEAGRTAGSPKYAPVQTSTGQIEAFLSRAKGVQARKEIDDFLQQKAAREAAQPAPPGTPQLPPPSEAVPAPAAAQPGAAPAPAAPAAPVAGARPVDETFPSFEEPGRASPPAPADDWITPQETPNDRQGGQQVLGQVGEGQEPGNVQQPGGGGAAAQAGGALQAPQGAQTPVNQPRPNVGPANLQELLADPRTADQIRADRAAERGTSDAVAKRGAADAAAAPPPSVIALTPPASTPVQTGVNPQPPQAPPPSLQQFLDDPRKADEIRAQLEAAKSWQPTPDWQEIPQAPGFAPPPGLETRTEDGKAFARIPPTRGTPEAPVELTGPADVHHGAEITAEPTPAQAEAGNYRKRHVTWNGLDLAIETEAGQERTGIGGDGKPWSVTLQHPYGYIKRTRGADGDQVDVYLGPQPQSPHVYIVDQIDHQTGQFDEHKALLGFPDEASARAAYSAGFSDGLGNARMGALQPLTVRQFKTWLESDLRKPIAYSDPVQAARGIAKEHGLNATDDEIAEAVRAQKVNNTDLLDELVTTIEHAAIVEEVDSPDSIRRQEDAHVAEPANPDAARAEPAPAGEQAGRPGAQEIEQAPAGVEPGQAQLDQAVEHPGLIIQSLETGKRTTLQPIGTKPPTPQVTAEPGTKYVLPSFAAAQYAKPKKGVRDKSDWTEIGRNEIGQTLHEDQNGVRSYVENGVRVTEAVPIRPTRGGVEIAKPEHKDEWVLASEKSAPVTRDETPAEPALGAVSHITAAYLEKLAKRAATAGTADKAAYRREIDDLAVQMEAEGRKIAEHCVDTGGKFSLRG